MDKKIVYLRENHEFQKGAKVYHLAIIDYL
jgi:hypothetical protein